MSDGMGREFTYLSSHATNRYFIPNWGIDIHGFCFSITFFLFWGRALVEKIMCIDIGTVHIQKTSDSVNESNALALLYKRNDIAAFPTSVAFVTVHCGVQHQGGGLLLMKDTTAFLSMWSRRL